MTETKTQAQPGTSTAEGKEQTSDVQEAYNLLAQGKRNLLCGEVLQATQQLQEACKLLSEKYGEVSDQCGEAYLAYGTSLLEYSRMETGVLGNALKGINSESEEDSEVSDDKVEDPENVTDNDTSQDEEAETADDAEDKEENSAESEALDTEEEGADDANKEGAAGTEADTSQDDVSNLQLAWEMFELAKVIFARNEGKEMKLKSAEALLKLGEVGLETEQYETAIDDFSSCLKIQVEQLEPESRLIAETHYQIGVACTLACRYTEALDNYRLAIKVIESKIAKLKSLIEESEKSGKHKEAGSFDENVINWEKEIKDLQDILPDIRAKIEDTEDEMKSTEKVKELVKESVSSEVGTTIGFGESSKQSPMKVPSDASVKDISHMVRKKRKPEEQASKEDSPVKKPKQETATNGETETTNGTTNGDAEMTDKTSPQKSGNGIAANGDGSKKMEVTEKKSEEQVTEIKTKTIEDVKKLSEQAS